MNSINHIRLFVAVPIPSSIKQAIDTWMEEIKPHFPFRKWVHPSDLHITLQFLGDTPADLAPQIMLALEQISKESSPLTLRLAPLGTFGRPPHPSVLWAGISGDVEGLHSLQQQVVRALIPMGFTPEERTFHPHMTLARNYASTIPFDRTKLSDFPVPSSPEGKGLQWTADEITLYRSHLNRRPMYEVVTS
ncbi:RNA 2',3'-cyclic phosphodiesterase [Paenibacillus roseipurpureus]|uniref:RNA 2',3'-cyclic phosphodiesterase n=1 Tax=Paenibacillus roseopurpureus TaxID=2918901 RepID=A0AA96LUL6_9BACL|nr:RNA 2',3'-cyclic phosphodiesterase [Paenibacillus sp. MBLB1832]WNR46781.1 RNA 2',3'-cyclic phosphodiesterase [Paenibacillus sp. MBLB1832]